MPLHRICVDGAVRRSADARANGRRCNACGQALLETLVAALALLPLLLALGLLAKHLDVRHAVVSASRYLAFECTAHPDGCAAGADASALADDVRRRFFDDPVHPIASADPPPDPDAAALGESFWFDRTRRPLLERFGDVASELRQPSFDAAGAAVRSQGERAHPGAVSALAQAGPSRFGLEIADGLIAADVVLRLAASRDLRSWVERLLPVPMTMRATTAVLADAWTASGPAGSDPASVETRVEQGRRLPLVESALDAAYLPVRGLLTAAAALGIEPAAGAFRYHEIDVDLVPLDRLPEGDPARARVPAAPEPLP